MLFSCCQLVINSAGESQYPVAGCIQQKRQKEVTTNEKCWYLKIEWSSTYNGPHLFDSDRLILSVIVRFLVGSNRAVQEGWRDHNWSWHVTSHRLRLETNYTDICESWKRENIDLQESLAWSENMNTTAESICSELRSTSVGELVTRSIPNQCNFPMQIINSSATTKKRQWPLIS